MVATQRSARRLFNMAFIQRALGRPARAAELCRAALQTPDKDYSMAHLRAHEMLSVMEFPGEDYLQVMARIHEHLNPATYLEIGIDQGSSFDIVRPATRAVGIDPTPSLQSAPGPNHRVFAQTSDDFFERNDVIEVLGGKTIDLAFIDGMHLLEFALRDFINVERYCSPDSTILIHDVYPIDAISAARERSSRFWSGDIWRLVLILKKYRPDVAVNVIAARPTGLAIVQNLDPNSRLLSERIDEVLDEFLALDISVLDGKQDRMLNRFPNDWPAIADLIDSHGRG